MVRPALVATALSSLGTVPDKTLRLLIGHLRNEGRLQDAEVVIAELEGRHGLSGPILDLRAELHESAGDLERARRVREDRVSRFPDALGWMRLARFLIDQRPPDWAERLRDVDGELDRTPESDVTIEMARVEIALERGRPDDARVRAEALLIAAPRSSRPGLTLARIALLHGQIDIADRYLQVVVDKFGQRAAQHDVRLLLDAARAAGAASTERLAASLVADRSESARDVLEEELVALFEAPPPLEVELEPVDEIDVAEESADDQILRTLQTVWGYDELRPGQAQVIQRTIEGLDTLAIMPTGAGKSLTFQLPALVLDGPVVVVSPLIALMHDQLTTLPEPLRSQSTLINSTLHPEEMDRRLYGIERGHYKLIYAAPERFRQQSFLGALRTAGVRLVVIDEAHCVSMWGHDFRPDYFFLTRALEELGDPPTLAVTATATNAMAQQISTSLGRTFSIVRTSAFRENLFYSVERFQKKEDKATRLVELCKETDGPTIVYVPSRKEADALAGQLRYHGVRAVPYHAGMASGQRTSNQNDFLTGSAQVIVATIAFGMGINKPNVRLIVHFAPSRSLEAYIQESGRAGRDGEPSKCVLLYTTGDTATIRRHAGESAVTIEALRTVYRIIRDNAAGRWSLLDRHELAQIADEQEIDVNVAIGLLEQAALIRRHPDCGRVLTLRWSQRSADSDNVAPNDRFGAWLNRVSSGSAIVTAPTATACAELDCSPSVLERAIASHHGIAATFQMPSVCLEMLPASEGKVDMVAMLDRLMAAQRERAEQMITYLTTTACRHVHLARHLGEKIQPCGTVCDRCTTSGSRSQPLRPRVREKRRDDPYFAALAQWRTEKARERVVPAFVIASDRLLDKLATERPTTRSALRNISGIGDIKDQEFGEELVELIRSVTASQN